MIRSRTGVILFLSGILFTLIILTGIYFTATKIIWKNSRLEISSSQPKELEKEKNQKVLVKVFTVAQKIKKNEEFNPAKIKIVEVYQDLLPSDAIVNLGNLQGKKAAVPLEPNTLITQSMFYSILDELKETDRLKDYEMSAGLVGGMVAEGVYIDIEFINPKGETYVVLSKKLVKKRLENNKIILLLSLDERKLINYALAEQKVLGGTLEAIVYADERQPALKTNYPLPKLDKAQQLSTEANNIKPQPQFNSADAPLKGGN